jgi:putative FmdB family regulatory protein
MPIYTYKCQKCGAQFDFLMGVGKGDDKPQCPQCKAKDVEKVFAPFGVRTGSSSGDSSCPTGTCPLSGGD